MRSFNVLTPFSLLSLHLQPTFAYWRMACSVSQTARIDPILSYGGVSGHVHKLAGGSNVNQYSTHASLLESTCSTCEVQSDKSAYWTPQLYYEHADGTIEEVQNDGMTVYYVGRGGDSSNTVPFPDGFKMISGDSLSRHYDTQNLTYLNTRPISDRSHHLNYTNCVNGLRAQINFQSCWDGVNLYLPGSAHVAYLSGIDYGVCPPTHPIPIPGLFFEVLYWPNRINQSGGGRFAFANGDATGFGFHGDFLNGWDQDIQTKAVQQCLYTDNGGIVSACAPLVPDVNENFSRVCPEAPSVLSEAVKGILPFKRLPGCNPITTEGMDNQPIVCPADGSTTAGQSSSSTSTSISTSISSAVTSTTSTQTTFVTSISSKTSGTSSSGSSSSSSSLSRTATSTTTNISRSTLTTSTRTVTLFSSGSQPVAGIFATLPADNSSSPLSTMTVTVTETLTITAADAFATSSLTLDICFTASDSNLTSCQATSTTSSSTSTDLTTSTEVDNSIPSTTTTEDILSPDITTDVGSTDATETPILRFRKRNDTMVITVTETITVTTTVGTTTEMTQSTESCSVESGQSSTYCEATSTSDSTTAESITSTDSTITATATEDIAEVTPTSDPTPEAPVESPSADLNERGLYITYRIKGRTAVVRRS